ncbi:hypothetical protein E4U40_007657 [Claviceps sp. LM458 group G5]|nr:hypothetical protein E4U40_007657 [Claviceps sp. LM458 group G5]
MCNKRSLERRLSSPIRATACIYGRDGRWVISQGNGQVLGWRSGIAEEGRAVTRVHLLNTRLACCSDNYKQKLLLQLLLRNNVISHFGECYAYNVFRNDLDSIDLTSL